MKETDSIKSHHLSFLQRGKYTTMRCKLVYWRERETNHISAAAPLLWPTDRSVSEGVRQYSPETSTISN